MSYGVTLEQFAKTNNRKNLLNEFSGRNNKKPNQITKSDKKYYWWNCPDCGNEYNMSVADRIYKNCNCPYCSGHRVLRGFNDIWTTHPETAKLLVDENLGYLIMAKSDKRTNFKCQECGHIIENRMISQITKQGLSCPICSDGLRYPEKFMSNILSQVGINFSTQKKFKWSSSHRYDFYIPSLNCIIETHGRQHYDDGCFETLGGKTLKEEQENDRLKENLAKRNGIKYYIVINCSYSELDFIKNNIINSDLSNLLDLNYVDWFKCHELSIKSYIKIVSDLWNRGIRKTKEIVDITGIGRTSVVTYLKQASVLGWCDYKPNKARGKSVVQLDLNGNFINEFNNAKEASDSTGVKSSQITALCNGKGKTAGGFKWILKSDFLKDVNHVAPKENKLNKEELND